MAGEPNINNFIGRTYTLSEACDVMRLFDQCVTRIHINWVDTYTKKPVSIGYVDAPPKDKNK